MHPSCCSKLIFLLFSIQSAAYVERTAEATPPHAESNVASVGAISPGENTDVEAHNKTDTEKQEIKRALEALHQLVQSGEKKHAAGASLSSLDWLSNSVDSVRIGGSESSQGGGSFRSDAGSEGIGSWREEGQPLKVVSRCASDQGPLAMSFKNDTIRKFKSVNGQPPVVIDSISVAQSMDLLFSGWVQQKDGALGLWKKRWLVLCPTLLTIHNNNGKKEIGKKEVELQQIVEVQQVKKLHIKIKCCLSNSKKMDLQFKVCNVFFEARVFISFSIMNYENALGVAVTISHYP
jgi:hypothetical protein